ncbi:MAG: aminopeptidase P family N-terminal domain-containing protein, partial [Acidimicrobiales bacterium]
MTPPHLPPMDVPGRAGRVRARLADAGCDALVVTRLSNIRYLTGFTGSAALLVLLADEAVFVTDGRYRDQSAAELAGAGVGARLHVVVARGRGERVVAVPLG